MIVVPVKEGENIERALKKFKRKFERDVRLQKPHASDIKVIKVADKCIEKYQ